MTDLYLVRHGETDWSAQRRHTSTTELDLTDDGVRQARAVAGLLRGLQFQVILSSPRLRARRTAELAGFSGRYAIDANLAEWNYGDYEGKTSADIRQGVAGWRIWTHPVPGGESGAQVMARMAAVVRRVRSSGAPRALCFGHGHSLRVLALAWLGLDVTKGGHFPMETATVSVLGREKETPALLRWNLAPPGR